MRPNLAMSIYPVHISVLAVILEIREDRFIVEHQVVRHAQNTLTTFDSRQG